MSILIFIISLALLILVHEFGHFIVAKKSGIRVDEFGLGFPPKIWTKKWGETNYTLNAIPFGGFVKIFGEDTHSGNISEFDKSRSFQYKPKWIQALVLVAGVTMNIIFAWLLLSLGFMIGIASPMDSRFGDVTDVHVVITEVLPDSPAKKAGLRAGDAILSLVTDNSVLKDNTLTSDSARDFIEKSDGKNIGVVYTRGNSVHQTAIVEPNGNIVPGKLAIGVGMENVGLLKLSVPSAFVRGAQTTYLLTKATVVGITTFIWNVVTLKADFSQVSGPVGIAGVVGEAEALGFVYLLSFVALISINLAVINLLPFPALDGGRLLFVFIEAIIRRPISSKFVRWTNTIGFVILLVLMLIVTGHDILKLL